MLADRVTLALHDVQEAMARSPQSVAIHPDDVRRLRHACHMVVVTAGGGEDKGKRRGAS